MTEITKFSRLEIERFRGKSSKIKEELQIYTTMLHIANYFPLLFLLRI